MGKKIKKAYNNLKIRYRYLKKNINYIRERCDRTKLYLFFDIIWCYFRYNITQNEYRIFEFYKIDAEKRKTYLSIFDHDRYLYKQYNKNISNTIENSKMLYRRFKEYFYDEIFDINSMNFKSFEVFALENKSIYAYNNSFAKSFKEYNVKDFRSPAYMCQQIKDDKLYLMSKKINQKKDLNAISDLVVINVVTFYNKKVNILSSSIKFRDINNKLITGYVNYKDGKIKGNFKDEKGISVNDSFDGFEIPSYSKIIEIAETLAKEMEEIKEIEWSFVVSSRGKVYLIDAGRWSDYVFAQTPEFLNNRVGLKPYFKKITN